MLGKVISHDAVEQISPILTEVPYSVVASHNHVRNSVGIFDVGHMVQSK